VALQYEAPVVVTLDPRRDTPGRLPAIAAAWGLERSDYLLSGVVVDVESVLTAWGVSWDRDALTGEIVHTAPLFVVDEDGRRAWRQGGGDARLAVRLGRTGE
jgi:cytochrome oxidase Cu insertion factor (SCO1/SenC/PrrC family)